MAACLTEPVSEAAAFGLIFMDARRYPFLCGHATIGAVATLIEAGILACAGVETTVVVDTPSGPMTARARLSGRRVESVAIQMVPSFVYSTDQPLELPALGRIVADTVCVGGFFIMVSTEQLERPPTLENSAHYRKLGMELIDAANRQITVRHPLREEVRTVDVVSFYDPRNHGCFQGTNIVVYGESNMDRSPCGTGTAAKMTLLHHRGQLGIDQVFHNTSPLGTVFEGRVVAASRVGDIDAVITEIRGSAHITGVHRFVLDGSDPFPEGFILS
jgi:proline racemase